MGHTVHILESNPMALLHNQGTGIVTGGDVQDFFACYDTTYTPIVVMSYLRQYLSQQG